MAAITDTRTYPCHRCESLKNTEVDQYMLDKGGPRSVTKWLMNERREGGVNEDSYIFENPNTGKTVCACHYSTFCDCVYIDIFTKEYREDMKKEDEYEGQVYVCNCDGKTYKGMRDMIVHFESTSHLNFIRKLISAGV